MKIGDVMNESPLTVDHLATLRDAATRVSQTQVSDLMVVNHNNEFIGVLSEGDLIRAALPNYDELMQGEIPLNQAWKVFLEKGHELCGRPIAPFLIQQPIFFTPQDELLKAAATMINRQIRILPVLEKGKLVGTISRGDLAAAILKP